VHNTLFDDAGLRRLRFHQRRPRAALGAALALGPSPAGFGVAQVRPKVLSMTGQSDADYERLRQVIQPVFEELGTAA